jgi:DNA ligase-1
VTIGKAYNGLTDVEIQAMTERLLALTVEDHGHHRTVRPEIVLEVAFNHLQRSARHASGYALRFPRIVRIRPDRRPENASTLADVERLAAAAAGVATGRGSDAGGES